MERKNWFRVYLEDVRISLIISLILNAIQIFGSLAICMSKEYETLWYLTFIIGVLLILSLLVPFLYKLVKKEWRDVGLIASLYILIVCYFNWFVIIG